MTIPMTPKEFFEAALVAVGPPPPPTTSYTESPVNDRLFSLEFVEFREEAIGIPYLDDADRFPVGCAERGYSYQQYCHWWRHDRKHC